MIVAGDVGATIWQPFAPFVQPLEPAPFVARTRYQYVPDVFPVTSKNSADPLYTCVAFAKLADVSSSRSYDVAPVDDDHAIW